MGLVLEIPALPCSEECLSSQIEQPAGCISYGLFLAHFLVICVVENRSSTYGISVAGWQLVFTTAMVSVIASYFAAIYIDEGCRTNASLALHGVTQVRGQLRRGNHVIEDCARTKPVNGSSIA